MDIKLHLPSGIRNARIAITGSKSITNRLLLLRALFPGFEIRNSSSSDDSEVMLKALEGNDEVIDIHHAGTAMRFLTAYFAIQEGREVVLTGSQRMRERPIAVLVNALRSLGAHIEYLVNEGFPPLKITGRKPTGSKATIQADVSSQYITALLLIAGRLENGLELTLEGTITSRPYIEMTLSLLNEIGIKTNFHDDKITVFPTTDNQQPTTDNLIVESDWSSASYFYSITALSEVGTSIKLSSFKKDSLQGDSALQHIYRELGVETEFEGNTIILRRTNLKPDTRVKPELAKQTLNLKLLETPDIAQTIAVTCFGLGIGCNLTGLHTLKIKETDRLSALKTELEKLGAKVTITSNSLTLEPNTLFSARALRPDSLSFGEGRVEDPSTSEAHSPLLGRGAGGEGLLSMSAASPFSFGDGPGVRSGREEVSIETYNDHRMALAFAPLAIKTDIIIKDAGVISKSYPAFWDDLEVLGFEITHL